MSEFYPTMREVRLNKTEVIEALKSNRHTHRTKFEEAMDGYQKEAVRVLEKRIAEIKKNANTRIALNLPLPEDHTEDYDLVISMLERSLDDEVVLTAQDYAQYILDDWGWKQAFEQTYMSYTGSKP